ncbi:hypothetical protein HYZ41_01320 [archaeon]|nr:hypothetical protein [archaeon]
MKHPIAMIGIFSMLGMFLLFYVTFSVAFYSPAKAVIIDINSYGEAEIEFILLSVLMPLNILSAIVVAKKLGGSEKISAETEESLKEPEKRLSGIIYRN